jgi:hypothetical protein
MVQEWPPNVWHGVIDPITGEKIPPTRCETTDSLTFNEADERGLIDLDELHDKRRENTRKALYRSVDIERLKD